jgi:hypothetical protein
MQAAHLPTVPTERTLISAGTSVRRLMSSSSNLSSHPLSTTIITGWPETTLPLSLYYTDSGIPTYAAGTATLTLRVRAAGFCFTVFIRREFSPITRLSFIPIVFQFTSWFFRYIRRARPGLETSASDIVVPEIVLIASSGVCTKIFILLSNSHVTTSSPKRQFRGP